MKQSLSGDEYARNARKNPPRSSIYWNQVEKLLNCAPHYLCESKSWRV